jgi:hypothetical protein
MTSQYTLRLLLMSLLFISKSEEQLHISLWCMNNTNIISLRDYVEAILTQYLPLVERSRSHGLEGHYSENSLMV